jgi:hypothetical protein
LHAAEEVGEQLSASQMIVVHWAVVVMATAEAPRVEQRPKEWKVAPLGLNQLKSGQR